jgi:2-polyprenyl-3-methyl-5-hydroxy-6-metoxy-1,4-benzoquinol methylase
MENCPLCQNTLQTKLAGEFFICNKCGLMVRKVADQVDKLYRSGWLDPLENLNLTGGTTPELSHNYSRELVRSLGFNNLDGKRILDFGGGRGEMALALEAAGAKVVIVDPYSQTQLKEKGMWAVGSLAQLANEEPFDGAVAIDVVEHLTAPWEELGQIRKLLKAGGWLYLSTPNGRGINARLNRGNWREALNPSHLLLFSPPAMEMALQKAGFSQTSRLRWRVAYSESKWIQGKDWFLRALWLDGVLRYLAYV